MADEKKNNVPDSERIVELWLAIKTLLAGKVDTKTLESYPTIESVASTIASALTDYAKSTEVENSILDALSNYMTTAQVNEAIANAVKDTTKFKKEVVDVLPEIGEDNVIYLVPSNNPIEQDMMIEYLWVNGNFERIGSTTADMTQYWSKQELTIMTAEELREILV